MIIDYVESSRSGSKIRNSNQASYNIRSSDFRESIVTNNVNLSDHNDS